MTTQIINYKENSTEISKNLRNLDSLPNGLGCRFLLTIKGKNNDLIAKQWKRKAPKFLADNEILITF